MNILLLEPDYKSTYPPLGLMKLAYYHKEYRQDFVWLAKGKLPNSLPDKVKDKIEQSRYYSSRCNNTDFVSEANAIITGKKWDRIYVTTLFTYEWDKTIAAIEYAKTLVDVSSKVFVGGILATLMPEELEAATGIKPITGLLTSTAELGFDDRINVDLLTPDYAILDLVEYEYPMSEHYLIKATRGCGMKCSFCAVQSLEPDCVDYVCIKDIVREIDDKYGYRKNLILMDNNILKSSYFEQIIQDMLDLGYEKFATKINPKTGKKIRVYIDFNQGLDMNFLTERKMEMISCLAVKTLRIAFDHISDKDKYTEAMELADRYNIKQLSNYLLYNTVDFKGKGKIKAADTPKNLYERLIINVGLQDKFNARRRIEGISPVAIFSFPMKFVPLENKNREFIGTHWNKKMIRALQRMSNPVGGAIHSTRKGFEQTFGKSFEEFHMLLQYPAIYLENRFANKNKYFSSLLLDWNTHYTSLPETEKSRFEDLIASNDFTVEKYLSIEAPAIRNLYAHYTHGTKFLDFLRKLKSTNISRFRELQTYLTCDCPEIVSFNIDLLKKLINANTYLSELIVLLFEDVSAAA